MAVYYVDTSAALKRYRTEKGTDVVDALYESISKPVGIMDALLGRRPGLSTSHFTCLEVESVAVRTVKSGARIDRAYMTLLGSFARDLQDYLSLEPVDGGIINNAIEMARRTRLRPGDCIHLATALNVGGRREDDQLVIVASDKELLAAAEGAGIKTLNPEADDAMEVLNQLK